MHVPYRGNAPAMTDLIAGRIQLVSSSIGQFRPAMDAGKIRLLLTATKNRLPYLPDVPTSAEAGLPGYLMSVWIARRRAGRHARSRCSTASTRWCRAC